MRAGPATPTVGVVTLHPTTHRARTPRRTRSITVVAVLIAVASGCSSTARGPSAAPSPATGPAAPTVSAATTVATTASSDVTAATVLTPTTVATTDASVISTLNSSPTAATSSAATTATTGAAIYAPCSLITEAEAGAALGADPGPGLETPEPWGGQCNFGDGAVILNVLSGPTHGGQAVYATYLAGAQRGKAADTSGRSVFAEVGGIGQAAFVSGGGPIAASVFYANQTTVALTIGLPDIALPTPIAQVTALAKAVAARVTH